MAQLHSLSAADDCVIAALAAGLETEFGRGGGALAQRFLEAEQADFHWEARLAERWIGVWDRCDSDEFELDRVRILGRFDGSWFVAEMLVDGDGNPHNMIGKRDFDGVDSAQEVFAHG